MLRSTTLALCLLATVVVGCDSADIDDDFPAGPQSAAGVWEGTITHSDPDLLDGRLELTLTQVNRAVTGTARWSYGRQVGSRFQSINRSGSVLGTVPSAGPVTYTITFDGSERHLHDMTLRAGALTGTWVSDGRSRVSGTSTLSRR